MGVDLLFDPTEFHVWFDDFDKYTAADWTITTTEGGAGSATEAVGNLDGGVLVVTNDDADDDRDFFQWTKETFKYESGKALYFASRFKVSDATDSDLIFGLQITDTTPLAVTDGVFFRKNDGDTGLDFVVCKDSTETVKQDVAVIANDTWVKVAFYYDGSGTQFTVLINDVAVGSAVLTNAPDDEELTISFGIQNGAAAAKVLSVDYIIVAKAR